MKECRILRELDFFFLTLICDLGENGCYLSFGCCVMNIVKCCLIGENVLGKKNVNRISELCYVILCRFGLGALKKKTTVVFCPDLISLSFFLMENL